MNIQRLKLIGQRYNFLGAFKLFTLYTLLSTVKEIKRQQDLAQVDEE